jgi:hypothetical protein
VVAASPKNGVLRQGEILSDVIQLHIRFESLRDSATELDFEEKEHPFALLLTQDCDLDWDFKARAASPSQVAGQENKILAKLVPNILLCELTTTEILKPRLAAGSDILRRIRNNQDERYHWFPAVSPEDDAAGQGLPELIADFKRIFSIPTEELYLRLSTGVRRRVMLGSPYLQHLTARFGYYCLRVALPEMPLLPLPNTPSGAVVSSPTVDQTLT